MIFKTSLESKLYTGLSCKVLTSTFLLSVRLSLGRNLKQMGHLATESPADILGDSGFFPATNALSDRELLASLYRSAFLSPVQPRFFRVSCGWSKGSGVRLEPMCCWCDSWLIRCWPSCTCRHPIGPCDGAVSESVPTFRTALAFVPCIRSYMRRLRRYITEFAN